MNRSVLLGCAALISSAACADVFAGFNRDLTAMGAEAVESPLATVENEARFVSTTITDLSNANGWANKQVPPAGSEVSIEGAGVVAIVSSEVPQFARITVKDGAELRVALGTEETFPNVVLVGESKLTVSGKMNVSQTDSLMTSLGNAGEMPVIEVVANGVLTVPGGMSFRNVDFRLTGAGYDADYATLQTVGEGPLTFGYAAAGETTKIAFASTFGKILTPGTRGKCNTRFAYVEGGGAITVVGEMLAKETEFTRNKSDTTLQHGFNIGHGMNPEVPFNVTFDACRNVTCLYDTTIEGGAVVTVANGTVIGSTFTTSNNGSASQVQIHIRDKAKLILDGGSSLQMAITANWVNSYLDLSPSEDGWESLVVKNGSFVYLGRQQGNDKARITVEDGIWDCFYTHWWGADRLQWIFNHAKEVYVPADKTLKIRLVSARFGGDQGTRDGYYPMSWTPIVGEGNVVVANGCSNTFRLEMESAANTCTGTISVDEGQQKNKLFFEDGAVWAGKVVFTDRVSIGKSTWQDKSSNEYQTPANVKSDEPATVTLGAIELVSDFTIRLWGKDGLRNDTVNITGEGWSGTGKLLFAVQDDYAVQATDKWIIGTAPKGISLPAIAGKWKLVTENDAADDAKMLVVLMPETDDYNFVSNEEGSTNLSDPTAWQNGEVPEGKAVTILGQDVVAEINDDQPLPNFTEIEVKDGATLRVSTAAELTSVTLGARGTLVIAEGVTATLGGLSFASISDASEMGSLQIAPTATLKVPGGTMFKNCSLVVKGSLLGTTDGPLVFGTAAADETAYFAMMAEGATITALNASNAENASQLAFVRPDAGGTVVVTTPIVFKDSTFTYNQKDGFTFGLNNPSTQAFQVIADNTSLDFGADTYIAGGANLVMTNGSVLLRKRHSEGNTVDSNYNLIIQNRGKLTLVDRGELRAGVTRVDWNLTDGVVRLNPDEIGWIGLEVLEGGIGCWYKLNGLDKGTLRVANGTIECFTTYWWGWGNREHAFNKLVAVDIPAESTMIYSGVSPKMATNKDTLTGTVLEAPFTGGGDLLVRNTRKNSTFEPTLARNDNTCTGRLSVGADDGTAKARLHIADGANWAGTVVFDGRTDLIPIDQDHKNAELTPATVALAGVELKTDFTVRLWGKGTLTNDMINVTGAGWSGDGTLLFELPDGYDPQPTDKWVLGSVPKGAALPSTMGKWQLTTTPDPDDETKEWIVISLVTTDYNFISNADGSTNLSDPTAWQSGAVPTDKEVTILGANVVAEINDDQPLPTFASIAVKGGATLRINADLTETALPPISVDATSRIEVKAGATLVLPTTFTSFAKEEDGAFVSMAKIVVDKDATLTIPGGTYLKNLDLAVYGNLKSLGTGQITFGYANAGETAYFAFTADGAIINMPGYQNNGIHTRNWLTPAAGGRVKAVGTIVFKDTTFPYSNWSDYFTQNFCSENPSDEPVDIVFDNSDLQASYATKIGGAAHLRFTNGGLKRASAFANHGGDVEVVANATVVFEGENSGMNFDVSSAQGLRLNTDVANRNVVTLKEGAYLNVRRVWSSNGAGIAVEGDAKLMVDKPNGVAYILYEATPITVSEDAVLTIQSAALGSVGTNGDRDCAFLGSFAGAGEVHVTNLTPGKAFQLTMTQPSPDFTGTIKVVSSEQEDTPTTLCFAPTGTEAMDWSQATVVADGNVKFVNAGEETTPIAMTLGTLHIEEGQSLDLRLWKNGSTITCDTINLTHGTAGGGALNFITQGEEAPEARECFAIGTAPAGAWTGVGLRINGKRGEVVETPIEGSSLVTCEGRLASGMMIILR